MSVGNPYPASSVARRTGPTTLPSLGTPGLEVPGFATPPPIDRNAQVAAQLHGLLQDFARTAAMGGEMARRTIREREILKARYDAQVEKEDRENRQLLESNYELEADLLLPRLREQIKSKQILASGGLETTDQDARDLIASELANREYTSDTERQIATDTTLKRIGPELAGYFTNQVMQVAQDSRAQVVGTLAYSGGRAQTTQKLTELRDEARSSKLPGMTDEQSDDEFLLESMRVASLDGQRDTVKLLGFMLGNKFADDQQRATNMADEVADGRDREQDQESIDSVLGVFNRTGSATVARNELLRLSGDKKISNHARASIEDNLDRQIAEQQRREAEAVSQVNEAVLRRGVTSQNASLISSGQAGYIQGDITVDTGVGGVSNKVHISEAQQRRDGLEVAVADLYTKGPSVVDPTVEQMHLENNVGMVTLQREAMFKSAALTGQDVNAILDKDQPADQNLVQAVLAYSQYRTRVQGLAATLPGAAWYDLILEQAGEPSTGTNWKEAIRRAAMIKRDGRPKPLSEKEVSEALANIGVEADAPESAFVGQAVVANFNRIAVDNAPGAYANAQARTQALLVDINGKKTYLNTAVPQWFRAKADTYMVPIIDSAIKGVRHFDGSEAKADDIIVVHDPQTGRLRLYDLGGAAYLPDSYPIYNDPGQENGVIATMTRLVGGKSIEAMKKYKTARDETSKKPPLPAGLLSGGTQSLH